MSEDKRFNVKWWDEQDSHAEAWWDDRPWWVTDAENPGQHLHYKEKMHAEYTAKELNSEHRSAEGYNWTAHDRRFYASAEAWWSNYQNSWMPGIVDLRKSTIARFITMDAAERQAKKLNAGITGLASVAWDDRYKFLKPSTPERKAVDPEPRFFQREMTKEEDKRADVATYGDNRRHGIFDRKNPDRVAVFGTRSISQGVIDDLNSGRVKATNYTWSQLRKKPESTTTYEVQHLSFYSKEWKTIPTTRGYSKKKAREYIERRRATGSIFPHRIVKVKKTVVETHEPPD